MRSLSEIGAYSIIDDLLLLLRFMRVKQRQTLSQLMVLQQASK